MTPGSRPSDLIGDASAGLRFELADDKIGTLTLDRPETLNAINWDLYRALDAALERIARRDDVNVVMLRGAGRAFCAGGDITFMRQMYDGEIDPQLVQNVSLRVFKTMVTMPQPTIAVVDGPAIGLGCTLALCCDLVFAGERAVFADPHVQMGLVPGDGGVVLWSLLIGPAKAKQFLLTGDPLRAREAAAAGLVNDVFPSDEVHDRALAFARRLAKGPTQTLRATKALTNHVLRDLGERIVPSSLALEHVSQFSEYHREAVRRFLDGDPIRF